MTHEFVDLIVRINVALAGAVLVALALRAPARRLFGARVAYGLWLLPLAAAAMCFVPGRVEHVFVDAVGLAAGAAAPTPQDQPWLLWAWAAGAVLSLCVLALRQLRFTRALGRLSVRDDLGARVRAAESPVHGPAVIGVLRPIIVTPSDFESRFDAEERRIVLAHERAHLAQGDPWINAGVLMLQCLNWFNPLVHIGARALRMDQELACDATVLAQTEGVRRRYAEAMLKTHLAAAVPIGCAWPSSNLASFKERIAMLKRTLPSRTQRLLGASAITVATAAAAAAAWAAQPARVVATIAPADAVGAVAPPAPLAPDSIEPIVAHDDDLELEGGRVVIRNGEVVEERELTPEEREQVRAAVAEARAAMSEAREEIRRAMQQRELHADDIEAAIAAAAEARAELDEHRVEREAAIAEAREALEVSRAEREAAIAEARDAMREAQAEIARARVAELGDIRAEIAQARAVSAEVRAALAEASAELARAAAEARAAGDAERANELARVARALERAEQEDDED
jgi:beta-lactamase regulating signal transducer with metallopeptidase domain